MSRENVEIVGRIYERWAVGAPPWEEQILELYAEDLTFEMPHPGLTASSRDEYVALLRRFLGTWEEYRIRADEIRALPDGRVLVLFDEYSRSKGVGLESEVKAAAVWTLKDGRVVAYRAYLHREDALAALGLDS